MKHIAPLNALRAFEAAARTGSFANAALELGVSSAAVSQQVKLLEEHWGKTLFIRQGNRITLSDAGLTAYPLLGQSMESLKELSDMMRRKQKKKRLVLSAPQSVAETWLAPRLVSLEDPEMRSALDIRIDDDPVDFIREGIDIRICYGHELYSEYQVEKLFSDVLVGVASKGFVGKFGNRVANIEDKYLIHTDWGRDFSTSPNWSLAVQKDRIIDHNAGLRVTASSTALRFAQMGFGAALIPGRMAENELKAGQLQLLAMDPVPMRHAYRAAYPKRMASSPLIQSVIRSLIS